MINFKGTRMVKDGEDNHGLQTASSKIQVKLFKMRKPWGSSYKPSWLHVGDTHLGDRGFFSLKHIGNLQMESWGCNPMFKNKEKILLG